MSIKIYSGFKIQTTSFPELWQIVKKCRENIEKEAVKIFTKRLAGFISLQIDMAHIYGTEYAISKIEELGFSRQLFADTRLDRSMSFVFSALGDKKEEKNPVYDIASCSMTLFPADGCTLGMLFNINKAFYEALHYTPEIEEYGYWDNVDPLESVTQEEWEERRRQWEMVLTGEDLSGIPSREGLIAELVDIDFVVTMINKDEIIENIYDRSKRTRVYAENITGKKSGEELDELYKKIEEVIPVYDSLEKLYIPQDKRGIL